MVKPTDIELIYEFFEFAPRYRGRNPKKFNITSYVGKHILEHHRAEGYMARQEFEDCMGPEWFQVQMMRAEADMEGADGRGCNGSND